MSYFGVKVPPANSVLGVPAAGNAVTVSGSDANVVLTGTAISWDDMRIAASTGKQPAANYPDWETYKTNVGLYAFDKGTEQSLFFVTQLPHTWVSGTNLYPHVHWVPKSAGGTSPKTTVKWGLDYTWANHGDTFGSTARMTGYTPVNDDDPLVADEHYITKLYDDATGTVDYIDGTDQTISSMLICRVYRDADDATYDTYDDDAYLLEIDFHIQINTFGSNDEYTK